MTFAPRRVRGFVGWPQLVFLIGAAAQVVAILRLNAGKFCYSLDDPYIHLALAENLARGHYGLNPGIPSSAASSALWPLLLAPFAHLAWVEWLPLAINLVASLLTIAIVRRLAEGWLQPADRRMSMIAQALTVAVFLAINVVGVAFTGMEHALQLTAATAVFLGLVRSRETGRVAWWLVAALIAGPWLRYESLAISVPALVLLAYEGHRRVAASSAVVIATGLGLFSVVLHRMGMGWMPTSVLAKSRLFDDASMAGAVTQNLLRSLEMRQGAVLAVVGVLILVLALKREPASDRRLAIWGVAAVGLHFAAGTFGYLRYEIYIFGSAILLLLHLGRDALSRFAHRASRPALAATLAAATVAVGFPYVYGLYTGPLASNNIFEQQYQMHRFVTEYYPADIAANDIGWLSYRNDREVLDLWGISSSEVRARRNGARGVDWIDDLTREHGVEYAILYDLWFPEVPVGWQRVAEMTLSRRRVSPASDTVVFHAVAPGSARRLRDALREFEPSLPDGVRLNILPEASPDGP